MVRVNAALCAALGYERDELLSRTFVDITHPDDVRKDEQLAASLFRGEIPSYRLEKRFRTKDGQLAWLDLSAFVIYDDANQPFGFAMVENITERKRSEEALRTSEERYRSFIVNSSEAIWRYEIEQPVDVRLPVEAQVEAISKYSYLAECNDAMARLYGFARAEEVVGLHLNELISAARPDMPSLTAFVASGYRLNDTHVTFADLAAGRRYFSTSVIGIVINDYLLRFWGTQRDETAERVAETDLMHSRQQLRVLAAHLQNLREAERADLAREMHDALGQSLTGLKLDLARVSSDVTALPDAETQSRILNRLNSVSQALDQTIAQVKTISTELRPAVLDKFGLAAAIEWQCREFEKRSGIKCDYRQPAAELALGPEYSIGLFRILQESLTNVARHSVAKHATVSLCADESEVVLTISDDGRGISTAEISAPDSLGLLGMRERTDSLGGQFTVVGEAGKTIVEVRIPLTRSESNTSND